MARRAPKDERPFNPIESALVERVSSRVAPQDRLVVAPDPVTERPEADESFETQPQQAKRPAREKRVIALVGRGDCTSTPFGSTHPNIADACEAFKRFKILSHTASSRTGTDLPARRATKDAGPPRQ